MYGSNHPTSPTASSSVQVVVRLRPLNEREKRHGTLPVVSASTNDKSVTVIKGQGSRQVKTSYRFDNVFTAFSSQEEVFEATLKPIIRDVLRGFESTVFAYGQTGTGKTHTMEGDLSQAEQHGVIPRSAAAIFSELEKPTYLEHSISCSFLEIYNEDLCDLIADSNNSHSSNSSSHLSSSNKRAKLGIMEGKNGPFCRGLSETKVSSADEVLSLMRKAQNQRQVGETNMNKQSSRSHCIFTLKVHAKRKVGDGSVLEVSGKLHCVDLAGSECAKSANLEKGNEDQVARERERMNINRSLLTLGRVVSMLKEQSQGKKKNVRIPYRDSKLTRILQESLGGRCKTCLIATVSPSISAIEESMSTLNYAQTANGIVNKPVTSSFMMSQPSSMNAGGEKRGTGNSDSMGGAVEHWQEMECRLQYMQAQVEEAQQALARKHLQQQELMEKAEQAENARVEAVAQLEQSEQEKMKLESDIAVLVDEKENLSNRLCETEQALLKTTTILRATQKTEACLTGEANQLIAAVRMSIADGDNLYQALIESREADITRKQATIKFNSALMALFGQLVQSVESMKKLEEDHRRVLHCANTDHTESQTSHIKEHEAIMKAISENIQAGVTSLRAQLSGDGGLIPAVATTSSGVRDGIVNFSKSNTHGLTSLMESCAGVRNQLRSSSKKLKEMEVSYIESSAVMLERLTNEVMESKESLSQMVSSMTQSINQAAEDRNISRGTLRDLSEEWKATMVKSGSGIIGASKDRGVETQHMLEELLSESYRLDEVAMSLSKQRSFIEEQQSLHLGNFSSHAKLLNTQKVAIDETGARGQQLCNQVMANMMSGVQELVKGQLALLIQHQADSTDLFAASNRDLMGSSQQLTTGANNIFEHMRGTNETIQSHRDACVVTEQKTRSVLESAAESFDQIRSISEEQQSTAGACAQKMAEEIERGENMDFKNVNEMIRTMKDQGKKCGTQLATRILQGTQTSVSELTQSCKGAFAFTNNEIIDASNDVLEADVETMIRSIDGVSQKSMGSILESMTRGETAIYAVAKSQDQLLADIARKNEADAECINEELRSQKEALSKDFEAISKTLENHESKVRGNFNVCFDTVQNGEEQMSAFAKNVIRIDQETAEIDPRQETVFSEILSSTPSEDVILRDFLEKEDGNPVDDMGTGEAEFDKENIGGLSLQTGASRLPTGASVLGIQLSENLTSKMIEDPTEVHKRRTLGENARISGIATRTKRVRTRR